MFNKGPAGELSCRASLIGGRYLKTEYLRLKNSKGIYSAMGLTEYELDLRKVPKGLIAIIGPNGSGKTTILDQLGHFYRIMPYRASSYKINSFSYYNEFFGNDACIERVGRFECERYRSLINIDAKRKKQECYLFIEQGGNWAPYGHTEDGKTDAYDEAVEALLGSPKLFFTSNFRCQDATRLSDYTKGEVKDLFVELLAIDDLKEIGQRAKVFKDKMVADLENLQAEKARLEQATSSEPGVIRKKGDMDRLISAKASEIAASEEEMKRVQSEIQEIELKIGLQKEAEKNKGKLQSDLAAKEAKLKEVDETKTAKRNFYNGKYKTIALKVALSTELIKGLPLLREQAKKEVAALGSIEHAKTQIQEYDARYVQHVNELGELSKTEALIAAKDNQLQALRLTRKHVVESAQKDLQSAESTLKRLEQEQSDNGKRSSSITESVRTRKALYNDKQRVITDKEADCQSLLAQEPFLKEQIEKESVNLRLVDSLKVRIQDCDQQFVECSILLEGFSATELRIAAKERELQALQMTRKHVVESAEKALTDAESLAKKLERSTCGVLKDVCEFAQSAVEARNSIPGLRLRLEEVSAPVPHEAALAAEIVSLRESVSQKETVEQKAKEAVAEKAKVLAELAQVEAGLSEIRETLKALPAVESAKVSLVVLAAERQALILEEEQSVEMLLKDLSDLQSVMQTLNIQIDAMVSAEIPALKSKVDEADKPTPGEESLEREIADLKPVVAKKSDIEKSSQDVLLIKKSVSDALAQMEKDLAAIREDLKRLPEAEAAERTLPELQKELDDIRAEGSQVIGDIDAELNRIGDDIAGLKESLKLLDPEFDFMAEKAGLLARVTNLAACIEASRKEEFSLRQSVGAVIEALRQIDEEKKKLAEVQGEIAGRNREISEWAIHEKAFSNDGIITLEIDDCGPTIAGLANNLLYTCFGSRFSVRINTQEVNAKGTGLKETFDIVVYDNECEEPKLLKAMCGGEKTWIEESITRAICLFNAGRSGRKYSTLFTDEKDGALDLWKKKEFFNMKRKVLQLGKYDSEFFISQTPEIITLADGTIRVEDPEYPWAAWQEQVDQGVTTLTYRKWLSEKRTAKNGSLLKVA